MSRISFVHFCERVIYVRLTLGQRVVARVCFDGVEPSQLDPAEREVARVIFGDVDAIPPQARRILVLILGRGSGKTMLGAAFAIYTMVTLEITGRTLDLPTFVVIAPGKKTAIAAAIHMARELVRGAPDLERMVVSESTEGFVLRRPDGRAVQLAVFAASRGGASARGIPILGFVIDESWYLYGDESVAGGAVINDRDIFNALIPRLMKGAKGILISTPWPVETLTGALLATNFGAPTTATACIAPTLVMRDDDPELPGLIALERANDPGNTARERDCDLSAMTGTSKVFDDGAITEMTTDTVFEIGVPGTAIGAGADLAFVSDSSALAVVSRMPDAFALVALQELIPSKGAPLRPRNVVESFVATMKPFGATMVWADLHYAESFREHLEPHSIALLPAPGGMNGKLETYARAKKLIHEKRCWLPNNGRFLSQLRAVVTKAQPGGGYSIVSPRRAGAAHGDMVSAFVLAVHGAALAEGLGEEQQGAMINITKSDWAMPRGGIFRGGDF